MKRTKLKKLSPSKRKAFIRRADRQLQDHYRATYAGEKCESCGKSFELMHHFIEKSRSSFLRYHPENLIFICHRCHALHHQFGDATVMVRVVMARGKKWMGWIERMKRISVQLDEQFIRSSLKKLGIEIT